MNLPENSHSRQNLLTGEWVLVSPHRTRRPWQGRVDAVQQPPGVEYDPECYLCPGNARAGGHKNPPYEGPFAFDNDFAALLPDAEIPGIDSGLYRVREEHGRCRVVCFSPRHDRHLVDMTDDEVAEVLRFLAGECRSLESRDDICYVQAFENRGEMMGCSNPHPHAQVWATGSIPNEPRKELVAQRAWFEANNRPLLLDYLQAELDADARIVCQNDHAVALVPFWATWPFETLLVPRRQAGALHEMTPEAIAGFAAVLRQVLCACDRLFDCPMPYSMGYHPRPADSSDHPEWQLHAHVYPPLLRSASVRKYMVGFEMLAMPQRDLAPEAAAERLRAALQE